MSARTTCLIPNIIISLFLSLLIPPHPPTPGAWNWMSTNVLPYIIDWMFILILGLLMALFSFAIDYLIEKINEGKTTQKVLNLPLIELLS